MRSARRALYTGLCALGDALAALAPPEKPMSFDWPDAIRVDGGLVGGVRLAWPPAADEDAPPAWLVFGAMIRVAAMVKQRIEEGMQQCGLRPRHYAILQLLRTEGAVSQQVVGARLDIDPGTVVDLIDVLEERGLVERRRRVGGCTSSI